VVRTLHVETWHAASLHAASLHAASLHAASLQNFAWQTRFNDRIIRNQDEMNRIAKYIENNVANWETDELNKQYNNQGICLGIVETRHATSLQGGTTNTNKLIYHYHENNNSERREQTLHCRDTACHVSTGKGKTNN
jgi:hypothetical protein